MAKFPLLTLVVEDDFMVGYVLERFLEQMDLFDFSVVFATNLKSTLFLLESAYFPLILLDLKIHDSEGIATAVAVRAKCIERKANTAILPITSSLVRQEELDLLGLPLYIYKPELTQELLKEDVQKILHTLVLDHQTKSLLEELNNLCIHTNSLSANKRGSI